MDSVVYLPFRTINCFYVYDVNIHGTTQISDGAYHYLTLAREGKDAPCNADIQEEIDYLESKGYLHERVVKRIFHPQADDLHLYLSRGVGMCCLQLVQRCNLRCSYCNYTENDGTQRLHSNRTMSIETAKKAVDFYHAHSIDTPRAHLSLYGGEVLLEFELMREIIAYAKEKFRGKELTFGITTNGTLLKGEVLDFVMQNEIRIVVSVDGPKEINDKNRFFSESKESVFDLVMDNLGCIQKTYPDFFSTMQINSVIDPVHDFDDYIDFFENSIVASMNKNGGIYDDIDHTEKVKTDEKYISKITYHRFIGLLHMLDRYPGNYVKHLASTEVNDYTQKIAKLNSASKMSVSTSGHPAGPCIPGVLRLFVGVDGDMYPCERVSETAEHTKIGNVFDGFNIENAHNMLNVGKITEEQCKSCWAFNLCGACVKHSMDKSGKLSESVRLERCHNIKHDAYTYLRIHALKEEMSLYEPGGN